MFPTSDRPRQTRRTRFRQLLLVGNLALVLAPHWARADTPHYHIKKGDGFEQVARGCCGGAIVAAAGSPEKKRRPHRPQRVAPRDSSEPLGANVPRFSQVPRGELDRKAASQALAEAARRVSDTCGPSEHASVKVVVTLAPTGAATHVGFDPTFADPAYSECAETAFLAAKVPSFDGNPRQVAKTIALQRSQKPSAPPGN